MSAFQKETSLRGRRRVLLIEDDETLGPAMLQRLKLEGFEARLAVNGATAIRDATMYAPDIVLSDLRLPDITGEEIFKRVTQTIGLIPFYFMTAFGDVQQAVRLVKAGARDYLIKPVNVDLLIETIADVPPSGTTSAALGDSEGSQSPTMRAFEASLAKAARSDLPLMILGETGVGKEWAARSAHRQSNRAQHPFVAINCAAIPRELAESMLFGHERGAFTGAGSRMDGVCAEVGQGTLLLDEIAELPLEIQPKLLRLLQERTFRPIGARQEHVFQARIIAATHRDLQLRVAEGLFREDLYFRLAVVPLQIPALRERRGDIVQLARQLMAQSQSHSNVRRLQISADAVDALTNHAWPGNIRELRNRVERAVVMADGDMLRSIDFFPEQANNHNRGADDTVQSALEAAAGQAVRRRVLEALNQTGGNKSEAARLLGVSRTTIWKYAGRDDA